MRLLCVSFGIRRHYAHAAPPWERMGSRRLATSLSLRALPFLAAVAGVAAGCRPRTSENRSHEGVPSGLDPVRLTALTDAIQRYPSWNIHSVLVERRGRLVYEEYFRGEDEIWGEARLVRQFGPDSLHDVRSVSKSVISALIGIAVADGAIRSIDDPILDYLPQLADLRTPARNAITIRHALTMTAGLAWNEDLPVTDPNNDEVRMTGATQPIRYVFEHPIVDRPGHTWTYSGGLVQVLAAVLEASTKTPLRAYADEKLFAPLGITHYEWRGDLRGMPAAASGLRLRARDMVKLGSLFLHDGRWNGQQIVPAHWVQRSTAASLLLRGGRSAYGMHGYGFLWWHTCYQTALGTLEAITALGNGQQRIFILPQLDAVVALQAGRYSDGRASGLAERILLEYLLPAFWLEEMATPPGCRDAT